MADKKTPKTTTENAAEAAEEKVVTAPEAEAAPAAVDPPHRPAYLRADHR